MRTRLDVELKAEITRVLPVSEGVPFLGFVIFPAVVRLDPRRARRWRDRVRMLGRAIVRRAIGEDEVQRAGDSLIGWARHADSFAFRQSWVARRS